MGRQFISLRSTGYGIVYGNPMRKKPAQVCRKQVIAGKLPLTYR
ncbi:hypothetical protein J2X05_003324 [Cellvibrio fibrivorans]|uniref:Uncharacterized protein n=1 Tax=Cellvibrio fibrivorans TaxID=126350 RepID=A0ABU1V1F8_9GAMM|nr:hypothetical protein [Cellvibrio fibrivorans]